MDNIVGLHYDKISKMNLCVASEDGSRKTISLEFSPYMWANSAMSKAGLNFTDLSGPDWASLNTLLYFKDSKEYADFFKARDKSVPYYRISSLENQFLLANEFRMFKGLSFDKLRRLQLDIEVYSTKGFPNAKNKEDRIIAVGLSGCGNDKIIEIKNLDDESEKALLEELSEYIQELDPDIIEGHNIFKFDLMYIYQRSKNLKCKMKWGRFGEDISYRNTRLSIAERTFAFPRFDIAGRSIVDTLILVQLYDIVARQMPSYTLKASAIYFGISKADNRTYIEGSKIKDVFFDDRQTFRAYLLDDLRETAGLADKLLPTFIAQIQNFPLTLQECVLRGNSLKVESLFLEKYYHNSSAVPLSKGSEFFEGALSESFELGVFKNVLHYDVASLYPSIMLHLNKSAENDYLGVMLPALKSLRAYRLKYKKLARESSEIDKQKEYQARQNSFKILINSIYGYLGLGTALFGDSSLAREITAKGRQILLALIEAFKKLDCRVLEADTDGIYLQSQKYYDKPEELLGLVSDVLEDGIDLEFDGAYKAMMCYKAKNYALLEENDEIILKGSAFRNRATEPFLNLLTRALIESKLKDDGAILTKKICQIQEDIVNEKIDIADLAKSEYISKSLEQYKEQIEQTNRGRRASMQVAMLMKVQPNVGEKVRYYISPSAKKSPDWQKAVPLEFYEEKKIPYDKDYYLSKISDWKERFSDLIGEDNNQVNPKQADLFEL